MREYEDEVTSVKARTFLTHSGVYTNVEANMLHYEGGKEKRSL